MAVLFESFTDLLTTGREDLGFSKLWAELHDTTIEGSTSTHTDSWFGTQFMRLHLPNLVTKHFAEAPALHSGEWTHRKPPSRCLPSQYFMPLIDQS
jgi:hypothetical protein